MPIVPTVLLIVCVGMIAGCSNRSPSTANDPDAEQTRIRTVAVTSWPLYAIASQLVSEDATPIPNEFGDDESGNVDPAPSVHQPFRIEAVVGNGELSIDWKPSLDDVRRIQDADLLLINGAGFEPWRDRITLPRSRMIDTASGYYDQFLRIPDALTHQHGPDGKHSHPGTIWATWLDAELMASQARQVEAALSKLAPDSADAIARRAAALQRQIDRLEQAINKLAAATSRNPPKVLADGPQFNYLAKKLGWTVKYLHWPLPSTTAELSAAEVAEFQQAVQDEQFDVFLAVTGRGQDVQNLAESAQLPLVSIDLCERIRDDSGSIIDRLAANIKRLSAVCASDDTVNK
ncbi:MAG: metal ABC transporter substrate-binding protein [Planctomycetaceae bacterium]